MSYNPSSSSVNKYNKSNEDMPYNKNNQDMPNLNNTDGRDNTITNNTTLNNTRNYAEKNEFKISTSKLNWEIR